MNAMRLTAVALLLLVATSTSDVRAQNVDDADAAASVDTQAALAAGTAEHETLAASLQPSEESSRLAAGMPLAEADLYGESAAPAAVLAQDKNKAGLPFMIAGGAAFVAGLIIGGDAGTVVAVAGVGIGVYGIILYF